MNKELNKTPKRETPCLCPYCDEEIALEPLPFCGPCGLALRFCPQCHTVVAKETRLCPRCGTAIE